MALGPHESSCGVHQACIMHTAALELLLRELVNHQRSRRVCVQARACSWGSSERRPSTLCCCMSWQARCVGPPHARAKVGAFRLHEALSWQRWRRRGPWSWHTRSGRRAGACGADAWRAVGGAVVFGIIGWAACWQMSQAPAACVRASHEAGATTHAARVTVGSASPANRGCHQGLAWGPMWGWAMHAFSCPRTADVWAGKALGLGMAGPGMPE